MQVSGGGSEMEWVARVKGREMQQKRWYYILAALLTTLAMRTENMLRSQSG